jgi:teichuronic acid biosynthesis glycosyltransferase TuaH
MPEDRLAGWLVASADVDRLVICNPYRSVAGWVRARSMGRREAEFPASPARALYAPLRWRRSDPVRPAAMIARYESGLRRVAARLGLERPAVIAAHPLLAAFGRFDWAGPVTYYGWDDWSASEPHRRWWDAYDEAFTRLRDTGRRVAGVSEGVVSRIGPTGPHAVIPNGVQPGEWLDPAPAPAWFAALPRPRLVYVGALDSRLDPGQLEAVAAAFPAGSVTLVGPLVDPAPFAALRPYANVTIRPPVGRAEITGLLSAADACLIPHVRNDLTRTMSPLKLFEYLSAGRPVAAVDLPPIAAVESPRLVLVEPGADFAAAVQRALDAGPASEPERRAFVHENSWDRRFERLLELALAP